MQGSSFQEPCKDRDVTKEEYNTINAIRDKNGEKQMKIVEEYTDDFQEGILICGIKDLKRKVIFYI
ncbi:unnamed protein product [Meloidogyne enterolobii]|uniref:Uncharacterized protein n=1 Tax=Meloidogyne enterolobii TaxID=390850 RepID=A0ACB0XPY2_MELEN